jgi:hypothetical protein
VVHLDPGYPAEARVSDRQGDGLVSVVVDEQALAGEGFDWGQERQ